MLRDIGKSGNENFVNRNYEMKPRIYYYIYGAAGSDKSTLSKYLAWTEIMFAFIFGTVSIG